MLFLHIQSQYRHITDLCFIHNPFQTVFFLCKLTALSKLNEPSVIKCYIFFKPYMYSTKIYMYQHNKHLLNYKNVAEYILLYVMTLHSENELALQFPLFVHYIKFIQKWQNISGTGLKNSVCYITCDRLLKREIGINEKYLVAIS